MNRWRFLLPIVLLCGCVDVEYSGETNARTNHVEIFYSRGDVPKGKFREVGHASVTADNIRSAASMAESLREKAMQVGANALVITYLGKYQPPKEPAKTGSTWNSEDIDKHQHNEEKSCRCAGCRASDKHKKELRAIFLKKLRIENSASPNSMVIH